MNPPILRLQIREKLATGRLSHDPIARFWGGPGNGESCDACGGTVTKDQLVMESAVVAGRGVIYFHVGCLHVWEVERELLGHKPEVVHDHMPDVRSEAQP